ncbi:hydroxyethylthiazole kinase [Nocardioides fonticola]|uniref:hydroxyethylthiazole kinase n=1 Tax=Nocardioides fonticola TaxID=450363 RepID=UPI0031E144A4
MTTTAPTPALGLADVVDRVRAHAPLVHCITNSVVTNVTANVLLAAGASPAMVDTAEEAGVLAGVAGGLLVNLGTLTPVQIGGIDAAVGAAARAGVPWVLDPVAIGVLPVRTALAGELLGRRPAVVRGNASEIAALAGGAGGRGVDSLAAPDDVADIARDLARRHTTVVAVSGPRDLITDGDRVVRIAAGHSLMTRVTGVGCALGALVAACAAVEDDAVLAAAAATAWLCVAAEEAAAASSGPGTFAVALLDRLAAVDAGSVATRAGSA